MTPDFLIRADGTDITPAVRDRFVSLSIKDEAGVKSDQVTLTLDDRPYRDGRRAALPEIGTRLEVHIGYRETGLVSVGTFRVDEITYSGPPEALEVRAKHADMPGPFRTPVTRSWDDTTLGDIAQAIALEHGYEARVEPALGLIPIPHTDQTDESPMAFLNRLAAAHDGVCKPVAERLVVAPKGTAKSVSGQPLPDLTLSPKDLATWKYTHSARKDPGQSGGAGGTKAEHWDLGAGEMRTEATGSEPYHTIRYTRPSASEAAATAATRKNEGDRAKGKFGATLAGNARVAAEQKLVLAEFRPGIPAEWRIESVTHTLDRGGFKTSLAAELFQPGQEKPAEKATSDHWDLGF